MTFTGEVVDAGSMFEGFTRVNGASSFTSLIGDGSEETWLGTEQASARIFEENLSVWWAGMAGAYIECAGDFEIVVRARVTAAAGAANYMSWALAEFESDTANTGARRCCLSGWNYAASFHRTRTLTETAQIQKTTGAALDPAVLHWYRVKRAGAMVSLGQSADNVTWVNTVEDQIDVAGSTCKVGFLMNTHTGGADSDYEVIFSDLQMTYFPA